MKRTLFALALLALAGTQFAHAQAPQDELPPLGVPELESLLDEENPFFPGTLPATEVTAPAIVAGPAAEAISEDIEGDFIYLEVAPGGTYQQQTVYFLNSYEPVSRAFIKGQELVYTQIQALDSQSLGVQWGVRPEQGSAYGYYDASQFPQP
ncbi:hypothetical protein QBZ16_004714 [Prototheca wickerhamii]|uniref:DUF2782 domain-containing protein n=1 Tax=Prototheca wickerhamii TaxID=3111 RepID=A0AAD9IH22_PROWI|nr:hypothetical protein QBZ16_004714 [Prototheca wickerhamii]